MPNMGINIPDMGIVAKPAATLTSLASALF